MKGKYFSGRKVLMVGCKGWADYIFKELQRTGVSAITVGEEKNCIFQINMYNKQDWDKMACNITENYGKIHAIVNIGKISEMNGLSNINVKIWGKYVSNNLKIIFNSMNACQSLLDEGGSIVNIMSIGDIDGYGGDAAYRAFLNESKILTRDFALKLSRKKIRVNSLYLGYIDTAIGFKSENIRENHKKFAGAATPFGRVGTMQELFNTILFFISEDSSFITGSSIFVDGGLNARS